MRPGSTAPVASVRSATDRSISAAFSPSSRNTAIPPGRCSNGNAASSIPRTARAKAPSSSTPHHPRHRKGVRRLRRRRDRQEADQARARLALTGEATMSIEGRSDAARAARSGSAWSAAAKAPSSARCIGSPRAWTTITNWSPARCPRRPNARAARARRSACRATASTTTTTRWRRPKPSAPTGSRRSPSSRPTTCTPGRSTLFSRRAFTSFATSR